MSEIGRLESWSTARGLPRYLVAVSHAELHKYQVVRGDHAGIVTRRAQALAAQWDEVWRKRKAAAELHSRRVAAAQDIDQKKHLAAYRTQEAQDILDQLRGVLERTLALSTSFDWESLKDRSPYPVPAPARPSPPPEPVPPKPFREPQPNDAEFQPRRGLVDRLFPGLLDVLSPSRRVVRAATSEASFRAAYDRWKEATKKQGEQYVARRRAHEAQLRAVENNHRAALPRWEADRAQYHHDQAKANGLIDAKKTRYLQGDPETVVEYCEMVLARSEYPDYFPQDSQVEHQREARLLIVAHQLPPPESIPKVIEVRYVRTSNQFVEKSMPSAKFKEFYDNLLYQITLRTMHELFEADQAGAIESIVFNGYVHGKDPGTGHEINPCVLSVQATGTEFRNLNLHDVDPKTCFKRLKGVSSVRLHNLVPIPPIMTFEREDRRFVDARPVADSISEGDNLAVMPWEDFEHLIRELFEREFSVVGGEVRVTRSSRDAGVDAVVFDPDPLRGGKIVIQAKRYTNTVSVSAVRDLYGTLLNEGANKGILVTTADYGPDAYDFARGKSLVLMNGSNLLHLLERHGKRARIDLQEAKRLQGGQAG